MRLGRGRQEEDKVNRFIRERIRVAREERGMTQADLAELIYKSRVAVSDLERGRGQASACDLALIAGALEKPIAHFYPPSFRGIDVGKLQPDEEEFVHLFRKLWDPARQIFALRQLQTLVDSAVEADIEAHRRDLETYRLEDHQDPQ